MYYNSGNRFYKQLAYDVAVDKYKKALDKKDIPDAKLKLADSYRKMENTVEAQKWYEQAVDLPESLPIDKFYAAQAMMSNGNYDNAKVMLKQYLDAMPSDQVAQKLFTSCDSVKRWKQDSATWVIETPSFNSGSSNMSPVKYKDGFIFASDRDAEGKIYEWNGRPFLDLYSVRETAPGTFDTPKKLSGPINGKYHDGSATLSPDGKTIYFTRNNYIKKKTKRGSNDIVNLKIYSATKNDTAWTDIKELNFNSNDYSCGQPSLSADGNTLYFTSDMPKDNNGGTDIYLVNKIGDSWGEPKNLGTGINTKLNEMFPSVNGEDLYFSSEGHYGMGGLDIFKTTNTNGTWSQAQNIGYPLNSQGDDFGFLLSADNESGYLTSNRNSSDGMVDNILHFVRPELIFDLEVLSVNKADQKPLAGTNVELLNIKTGKKISKVTGADGKVNFDLNTNTDYTVLGSKQGFFSNSADVTTVGLSKSGTLETKLILELGVKPDSGDRIVLKNIYYDFDKSNIRPDAAKELDKLVKVLKDNPTIIIELGSHTDSRGSDSYNLKLSQSRATNAVKYIVSKGIEKNRITAKGYGETKLVNKCKNGVTCSEAEHQENRRTDFTIKGDTKTPVKVTK